MSQDCQAGQVECLWPRYPYKSADPPNSRAISSIVAHSDRSDGAYATYIRMLRQFGRPYQPTQEEVAIIAKLYPNDDPANPPWDRIQADIIAQKGWSPSEFASLTASFVVRMIGPVNSGVDTDSRGGFNSARQLADAHGVDHEKLRKRLDRWRRKNPGSKGWIENIEPEAKQPRYLYRESAVLSIIEDLK